MINFSEKSNIKIISSVLKRFEADVNGGTVFLYDVNSEEFWSGNVAAYWIITLIDGKNTVGDIYSIASSYYSNLDINDVIKSIDILFCELISKNFVKVWS